MRLIAVALRQPTLLRPTAAKRPSFPTSTRVAGNRGSSGPNKLSLVKNEIQSTTIASISPPTGKKVDVNVLRFLVRCVRSQRYWWFRTVAADRYFKTTPIRFRQEASDGIVRQIRVSGESPGSEELH